MDIELGPDGGDLQLVARHEQFAQRQPPTEQLARHGLCRHVDQRRGIVALQYRQRVGEIVAIAVVERDDDELSGIIGPQPGQQIVHGDEIDVPLPQRRKETVELVGRASVEVR